MMGRRRRFTKKFKQALRALIAIVVVILAGLIFYADRKLSKLVLGGLGEAFPTKVYAAPFILGEGVHISPDRLIERLKRLGYRQTHAPLSAPGDYALDQTLIHIYVRGFELPIIAQQPALVSLTPNNDNGWTIIGPDGGLQTQIAFEPELIAELSGRQKIRRDPAAAKDIPRRLKLAVVAAEDRRFYRHWGIDPAAIARALWMNLVKGRAMQGGSTITQQLAKNIILTPKRTLWRKAAEAAVAGYLELRYDKDEILAMYLNHIYMGQDGHVSIAGVRAAAQFYFSKNLSELTLAESATLAAIIPSPYRFNPLRDPGIARTRRNRVLSLMHKEEWISQDEFKSAAAEPMTARPSRLGDESANEYAYFTAELLRDLLERFSEEQLFRLGLTIHTTMDPLMQIAAQRAVARARHQAALTAIDPHTGRILALAGGKDFRQSQFNRATQAARQPGSAFKPFVYAAALEKGWTMISPLLDEPRRYPKGANGGFWEPKNYDGVYRGTVTVRQALALSLNAATLDLARRVGPSAVARLARGLGITSPLEENLGLALGVSQVTLLEMTAAYAAFANGGFRVKPHLISAILDAEGRTLEFTAFERESVLSPAASYLMSAMLESVVAEGTAKSLSLWFGNRPAAGKTGTTNDGRDAWFIGFTPQLAAGVWAGHDEHIPVNASGAKDALPLWAEFMSKMLQDYPEEKFTRPEGLVAKTVDPQTNLLAVAGCKQRREELFAPGTEPKTDCPLHKKGVVGWFYRLFGKE
ncbi:MAG: PBP1A family penicillin-binding protein [Elusimicrobia bacterium]|nr:PBP1A family penicillin-binding protein [Elusimicrobiota bacterium]